MDIQEVLANNVRRYRKEASLSQEKLAQRCGLHRTYVGGIEQRKRNPTMKTLQTIAEALDVDVSMLLMNPTVTSTRLEPGGAALVARTKDGLMLRPITEADRSLDLFVAAMLRDMGYEDTELVEAFPVLRDEITEFLASKRPQ